MGMKRTRGTEEEEPIGHPTWREPGIPTLLAWGILATEVYTSDLAEVEKH